MSAPEVRAPETLKVIERVNLTLSATGLTRERFRESLNTILTPARRLDGHTGLLQIYRWLNTSGKQWAEPRAEIILAMLEWLNKRNF